jgi:hypothetical protein
MSSDSTPQKRLFAFGYGYTADFLGRTLLTSNTWSLAGTTRDTQKRSALRARGIDAYLFTEEKPLGDPLAMLDGVTHILISTPPDKEGDVVYRLHGDDLRRIPTLKWIGYLSTTSVYGDRDGQFVDETAELRPTSIRGSRRVRAENDWRNFEQESGIPVDIFRMAGIYGPGRSALDSVRAGIKRRILKAGHKFSRVHVNDVVEVLMKTLALPSSHKGAIYNIADDEAAPSHEVIAYACRLLNQDPPPLVPFEEANLAPITLSFYSDNKQIKNEKIKNDLNVTLSYPNYRVGLEACLAEEKLYEEKKIDPPWVLQLNPDAGSIF